MLKTGQTKIPIEYRSCDYCKFGSKTRAKCKEVKRRDREDKERNSNYVRSDYNSWVVARSQGSCCNWEPREGAYEELLLDKLKGGAKRVDMGIALDATTYRGDTYVQKFKWLPFMESRPCPDDT